MLLWLCVVEVTVRSISSFSSSSSFSSCVTALSSVSASTAGVLCEYAILISVCNSSQLLTLYTYESI